MYDYINLSHDQSYGARTDLNALINSRLMIRIKDQLESTPESSSIYFQSHYTGTNNADKEMKHHAIKSMLSQTKFSHTESMHSKELLIDVILATIK